MSAAAWRRICQRSASVSNLRRHTQIAGTSSSRSSSAPAGCWPLKRSRIDAHHQPARFFLPGFCQARQFGTDNEGIRQDTKRHLYVVLDDNENGFNIHKLDMDNDDLDVGCGTAETPCSFSEPPALSIGHSKIGKAPQFAALGSHIIATTHSICMIPGEQEGTDSVILTYDTKTGTLDSSDILPSGLQAYRYHLAITYRNRLYVFDSCTDNTNTMDWAFYRGALHCLAVDPNGDYMGGTWRPLSKSSRFSWSWPIFPPDFPFDPKTITGHVVHPRTGTIFASAFGLRHGSKGTYCHGARGNGQWKRRGDWVLPFKGHAHYDDVLGAWVGLHLRSPRSEVAIADGYLCACRLMSGLQRPKWKVGKEKLLWEHPHWQNVDAKLVHMSEGSKYCLVERLLPKGGNKMEYVLRLTTIVVKYGEDGELRTMAHGPARFYKAPGYRFRFDVRAFWM